MQGCCWLPSSGPGSCVQKFPGEPSNRSSSRQKIVTENPAQVPRGELAPFVRRGGLDAPAQRHDRAVTHLAAMSSRGSRAVLSAHGLDRYGEHVTGAPLAQDQILSWAVRLDLLSHVCAAAACDA